MEDVHFEVFVASPHGSDVVHKPTLDEALLEAVEWSKTTEHDVCVTKVTTTICAVCSKGEKKE